MNTTDMSAEERYRALVVAQRKHPTRTYSKSAPVELRFVLPQNKAKSEPEAWIWCASQYEAAKLAFGTPSAKHRNRIHTRLYEGDWSRARRGAYDWVVRRAEDDRPPGLRGWHLVRSFVHTKRIGEYWLAQTYNPTSFAHKRRRAEFEAEF